MSEEKGGFMSFCLGFSLHPGAVYMKLFRPTDGTFYSSTSSDTMFFKLCICDP